MIVAVLDEATEDLPQLVKLTEQQRRERQRRVDGGEDTARLAFNPAAGQKGWSKGFDKGPTVPMQGDWNAGWNQGAGGGYGNWNQGWNQGGMMMKGKGKDKGKGKW